MKPAELRALAHRLCGTSCLTATESELLGNAIRAAADEIERLQAALLKHAQESNDCGGNPGCTAPGWDNDQCGCALEARAMSAAIEGRDPDDSGHRRDCGCLGCLMERSYSHPPSIDEAEPEEFRNV